VSQKARGFPAQSATSEILYSSPERADFRALTIAGVLPGSLLPAAAFAAAAACCCLHIRAKRNALTLRCCLLPAAACLLLLTYKSKAQRINFATVGTVGTA